jgi:hypothetical protein
MPYLKKGKDGKQEEIPVRYVRSDDYRVYYTHGAMGGILGSYHYRIDFYTEDVPVSMSAIEKDGIIKPDEEAIRREIGLSVYMSLPFARQLRDWLDRNIKEYENRHGEIKTIADLIGTQEERE